MLSKWHMASLVLEGWTEKFLTLTSSPDTPAGKWLPRLLNRCNTSLSFLSVIRCFRPHYELNELGCT